MRLLLFLMPILFLMACESRVSLDESELKSEEEVSEAETEEFESEEQESEEQESEEQESEDSSSSKGSSSSSSKKKSSSSSRDLSRSSSSSLQNASFWKEDTSKIKKLDEFPIDTAEGLTIRHYAYVTDYADGRLVPEMREKFGDDLSNIVVVYDSTEYCHVVYKSTGLITATAVHELEEQTYVLLNQADSLLFWETFGCSELSWNGCVRRGRGYKEKIMVGNELYYYSEDSHFQELVQLKDSFVYRWLIMRPDYRDSMQWKGWDKSLFANDSIVTFISADTLFIEKYNLKITDDEMTWVFENETCTQTGHEWDTSGSIEHSCEDFEEFYNEAIPCIQRNMGVSSDVYPRLCRKANKTYSDKVWCILDKD